MVDRTNPEDLQLSDEELLDVIKHHGTNRRGAMHLLGAGVGIAALSGTAAARGRRRHRSRGPHIDATFGKAYTADERVPSGLVDHVVEVHVHEHAIMDGDTTTVPFHFSPTGLQIDVGDVIEFRGVTPDHTVTAYHEVFGRQQRVPDDRPPFSSPVLPAGASWLYAFGSAGTYNLLCAPHEPFGMVMRLVVGDPDDSGYDGAFGPAGLPPQPRPPVSRQELTMLDVTSWPFPTAAEVLGTDALSVSTIVDEGPVSIADVEADL